MSNKLVFLAISGLASINIGIATSNVYAGLGAFAGFTAIFLAICAAIDYLKSK